MDLSQYINSIHLLPTAQQQELQKLIEQYERAVNQQKARASFLEFVKLVWPGFISGNHHRIMADAFERVANGSLRRLIINMPPRHTKSEFASVHLPAWYLGLFPNKKIIQASNTAELAVGFGRKVRDIIMGDAYQKLFPGTALRADSKAAGRWATSEGADYFAIGVEGKVTGKGADLLIIDDPHSEQEASIAEFNPETFDKVYEWYTSGPRQRLQPKGSIIIVMTRWSLRDLTARVIETQKEKDVDKVNRWEVIELPAILPSGNPLWPEFWSLDELEALRTELQSSKWQAQYMQDPTSEAGAIIKKGYWQPWDKPRPPTCEYIMCSFDTAFAKTERANYSACTTWGIFFKDDEDSGERIPCVILLAAWRDKLSFPELKARARQTYEEHKPDTMIIESRAAGLPLIYELRSMGIPIIDFTPVRGNDKISRANSIADIFASKRVFVKTSNGIPPRWAEEVIDECAAFPAGANDDYVDTVSQAMLRFRQGGWINTNNDEWGEEQETPRRRISYY